MKSELVCRYVYISYPNAGVTSLGEDLLDEVPDELVDFMNDQTNGTYTFDIESVKVPDDTLLTWMADFDTTTYIAQHESMTYNVAGACSGAPGEVHAEILTEILATYDLHDRPNPFEECDYIFFIHPCKIWEGYEGRAGTNLSVVYWSGLIGSTSGFHTHRHSSSGANIKQKLLTLSAHEFGHNMELGHPNYGPIPDGTMTYSTYDMMRTPLLLSWGDDPGLFSYSAKTLMDTGWIDTVSVIDERTDLVLYDLQSANRNAIVIPIGSCGAQFDHERFVLSYHQETGYDARHDSTGLQIWHDLPGEFSDIEAATGRWSGALHDIADPIAGVDRLDRSFWDEDDDDPYHDMSDHAFAFTFVQGKYDFFHVNDTVTYPDGVEFSYNTNPSTWGTSGASREDSNSVKTTLFVRARPRDAQSIYVDVYPMPREEILTPVDGDSVTVGEAPMTISWEHEFLNQGQDEINVLDQVRIYFSPHNGAPHSYQLIGTADHADADFDWYPTGESVTDQGKVKLVFTNDVNDRTTETVLNGSVKVKGTPVRWEAIISPNGGEALYANEPYDIQSTNFNGTDLQRVDIRVAKDSGTTWQAVAMDTTFVPSGDVNVFTWTPDAGLVGGQTRLRLTYHFNGGETAESISEADFFIYEIAANFADVTDSSGVDYQGVPYAAADLDYQLDGKPDLFVTIQRCEGCSGAESRSKLYRNTGIQTVPIRFEDRTEWDFAGTSTTRNESYGLAIADYDNDGDRDVFVTHAESPQLFNLEGGEFTDVIDDPSVFLSRDAGFLAESYCANWVDFNRDGYLDLYLGRGRVVTEPGGIGGGDSYEEPLFDTLFENMGPGAPFQEVGHATGLADSTDATVTRSAAWADMDGNGYWDVAVSGSLGSGSPTRLFQQDSDSTFSEVINPFPAGVVADGVNSLQWVDFDRDNDLDLLMVRRQDSSYVLINDGGQFNNGVPLAHDPGWRAEAGRAFDYDLDGYPDVIIANYDTDEEPYLWQNLMGIPSFGDRDFVEVAAKVGLNDGAGTSNGAFANDFDDDGDLDLVLGREATTGRVFRNESPTGADGPVNHWVGFDLIAAQSSNAMGATVTLTTAGLQPLGMQMVDPGSGRGSQQPHRLIFGLGDLDESVDVIVRWPSAREMTFTVMPAQFDNLMTINEPTEFSIDDTTVEFEVEVRPFSANLDWVFTWETDHWTDPTADIVEIEHAGGSGCPFTDASLQAGVTLGVTTRLYYQVDPVTQDITYRHEVRWENRPCVVGCRYRYSVESALDTSSDFVLNTQTDLIRFRVCPSAI